MTRTLASLGGLFQPGAGARSRRGPRKARVFVLATALVFCAMALWSAATPLYAAPDEPVQAAKAAAVVRGELAGSRYSSQAKALGLVRVPAFFALPTNRNDPTCYHRQPTIPASCAPALVNAGNALTPSWIYVARYPPLYYAIVGLPSLFGSDPLTLYLMRLVAALLSAVFVGLAVMSAVVWSKNRLLLAGVLVATTPMVLFLGGVVNPSGLEVAAAISVWTSGTLLATEHLHDPPPGLVAVLGASAAVFELVRALSPFWLALIALVLVGISDWRGLAAFFRRREPRWAVAGVALVGVVAVAWILGEHATDVYSRSPLGPTPETTILETSFSHNDFYLQGMIGVFGWFDTFSPTFTYVAWYGLVGLLALMAAVVARARQVLVLVLLTVAIVVVPVAISSSQVHRYGYTWSGRDTLPLAVGLPLLAAALIAQSDFARHGRRLVAGAGVVASLAQFAAFFEALRRYGVGTRGPDFGFLLHASWSPPTGFFFLLVAEAVVLALLCAGAAALVPAPSLRRGAHAPGPRVGVATPRAGAEGAGREQAGSAPLGEDLAGAGVPPGESPLPASSEPSN